MRRESSMWRKCGLILLIMGSLVLAGCDTSLESLTMVKGNPDIRDKQKPGELEVPTEEPSERPSEELPDEHESDKVDGKSSEEPATEELKDDGTLDPNDSDDESTPVFTEIPPSEYPAKDPLKQAPVPAPPGTPIRTFYELSGTPPTAPGLAMKHRVFKEEPPKIVYLTIDDGPSENTAPILEVLKREGVKATFFVIGTQVEKYPELFKQTYVQGNAIGNHTYSHNYSEIYRSPEDFIANLKKNEELIYRLIGIRPQVIRTPGGTHGNFHISYYNAVDAEDYLVYDWNVSTGDATAPVVSVETILGNIKEQVPGRDRVILLMHDSYGKGTTVEALPQIIQFLKKQGYEFGVLSPEVAPILFPGGFYS
ncbi:MAG: polysaccharide deacetylase family protein [Desulfitobacterium sp.]